jgi:hypothetical protein
MGTVIYGFVLVKIAARTVRMMKKTSEERSKRPPTIPRFPGGHIKAFTVDGE